MRITSGQYRGRILQSPEGLSTRPTSDRARQAMFNILLHAAWGGISRVENTGVLDLFAGTGALGLEALSRGASHAVFSEDAPAAVTALRANIAACRSLDQSHIMVGSALTPPPRPAALAPRQIVFCDPPYNTATAGTDLGRQAITAWAQKNWLTPDCIVVMEMAKKFPETVPPDCEILDERSYGVAMVRFLRWTGGV